MELDGLLGRVEKYSDEYVSNLVRFVDCRVQLTDGDGAGRSRATSKWVYVALSAILGLLLERLYIQNFGHSVTGQIKSFINSDDLIDQLVSEVLYWIALCAEIYMIRRLFSKTNPFSFALNVGLWVFPSAFVLAAFGAFVASHVAMLRFSIQSASWLAYATTAMLQPIFVMWRLPAALTEQGEPRGVVRVAITFGLVLTILSVQLAALLNYLKPVVQSLVNQMYPGG